MTKNSDYMLKAKAEFKAAATAEETAVYKWQAGGKAANVYLEKVDMTAKDFAEKVSVDTGSLSQARTIARAFPTKKALQAAFAEAEVSATVTNAYRLAKGTEAPAPKSPSELGESFGKSHADWSDDEFNAFVAAARKARRAANK